ncbi:MAG: hypothetical protein C0513_06035 [Isosphaera sp.]|nr:hypothetical protein [Isosphaera sp.]
MPTRAGRSLHIALALTVGPLWAAGGGAVGTALGGAVGRAWPSASAPVTPTTPAAHPGPGTKATAQERYLTLPLRGAFGVEVVAPAIRQAVETAERKQIGHVVIVLDSPGGAVADAEAISELMHAARDRVTFHVVCTQAISASVWVLANAQRIYVPPTGRIGAALVFWQDSSSGNPAVDQKFNAALASEVASLASSNGHNPVLFRAMMEPEVPVLVARAADGTTAVSTSRDVPGAIGYTQVHSGKGVLSLDHDQAILTGLALALPSEDPAQIGPLLGIAGWAPAAGDPGRRIAASVASASTRLTDQLAQAEQRLGALIERLNAQADRIDPLIADFNASALAPPASRLGAIDALIAAYEDYAKLTKSYDAAAAAHARASAALYEFRRVKPPEIEAPSTARLRTDITDAWRRAKEIRAQIAPRGARPARPR